MENATQQEVQDALELEQVVEENVVDDLNKAQINPLSAREKALEEIYNRRREEEHVQTYALQIIDRIQGKKVAKNYKAREVDGKVEKISDLSQINMKEGS